MERTTRRRIQFATKLPDRNDLRGYPHAFARPASRAEQRRLLRCYLTHNWGHFDWMCTDHVCRSCGQHWSRGADLDVPLYACTCPPHSGGDDRGQYAMVAPTRRWPGSMLEAFRRRRVLPKDTVRRMVRDTNPETDPQIAAIERELRTAR